jgi:trehalose utilization protein
MKSTFLLSLLFPFALHAADPVRVLVWDERQPEQKQAYGERFLGETLAAHLRAQPGFSVREGHPDLPELGLDEASLAATDVVIWWGHRRHQEVPDALARRVSQRVAEGRLGLLALHSAHWAKPFVFAMQDRALADARASLPEAEHATARIETTNRQPIGRMVRPETPRAPHLSGPEQGVYTLFLPGCIFPHWRADGAPGHLTTKLPGHPIAAGLPERWTIPRTEMYGEPFHVPEPDAVVFEERWDKGEWFRSGCAWTVGKGRVFYFRPGHETYPVFLQAEPLQVVVNATLWLAGRD